MLRIVHCLDNRPTDGGEVKSLTGRPRSEVECRMNFFVLATHMATSARSCHRLGSGARGKSPGLCCVDPPWVSLWAELLDVTESHVSTGLETGQWSRLCDRKPQLLTSCVRLRGQALTTHTRAERPFVLHTAPSLLVWGGGPVSLNQRHCLRPDA
jgi:hypothetical protein